MTIYTTALLLGFAYAALGIGIFISMRIFQIPDITTDGSFTLGGAVTAVLTTSLLSPFLILPLTFAAGAAAGALTGWIHTRLRINALLAGILVSTALYSVNLAVMGRPNVPIVGTPDLFSSIGGEDGGWQLQLAVLSGIVVMMLALMNHLLRSDFGLAMRATGNNETMARSVGISTDRLKIIGLALANGWVALSGYLITYVQGYSDIGMGIGIVILGLGSVMIGEMLTGLFRRSNMLVRLAGVVAGSVLFRILLGWTLSIGVDPVYMKLTVALFVLAAVGIPNLRRAS